MTGSALIETHPASDFGQVAESQEIEPSPIAQAWPRIAFGELNDEKVS
jgi:hypothetical protein